MLQKQNSFRNKYDEDDDEDDDSAGNSLQDQEPPYRSLTSPGGMRRYGTLPSLEMLDEKEQAAEDSTDSEGNGEWDTDAEEEDCNKKQEDSREYYTSAHICHLSHMIMLEDDYFLRIQYRKWRILFNQQRWIIGDVYSGITEACWSAFPEVKINIHYEFVPPEQDIGHLFTANQNYAWPRGFWIMMITLLKYLFL